MSKQLTLSIAASVMAMAAFAVLSSGGTADRSDDLEPRWSAQATSEGVGSTGVASLGQLLPVLQ